MRSLEIITEKVLIHGKKYVPAQCPKDLIRGKIGNCFDHTLLMALDHPHYKYVEGIAKRPTTGDWVLHAWLTDGVHAFDTTWGMLFKDGTWLPIPTVEYIGIEIDARAMADFLLATQYKSVLHNGWRDEVRSEKLLGFKFN